MVRWGSFEKAKAGEWDGLNNAAIYSFNSNIINSFVREMFQNSIDARNKDLPIDLASGKLPPLKVRIEYKELLREQFPDFNGFQGIFKRVSQASPNKDNGKFFSIGSEALRTVRKIPFFIYEDYNTTGLIGEDNDPEQSFNACVVSEGS